MKLYSLSPSPLILGSFLADLQTFQQQSPFSWLYELRRTKEFFLGLCRAMYMPLLAITAAEVFPMWGIDGRGGSVEQPIIEAGGLFVSANALIPLYGDTSKDVIRLITRLQRTHRR